MRTIPLVLLVTLCCAYSVRADGDPPKEEPKAEDNAPLRCQDEKTKELLPTAETCNDQMDTDTCKAIFGGGDEKKDEAPKKARKKRQDDKKDEKKDAGGAKRPKNCDLPDLATHALQCAKTCKICCETPEHACEDDSSYGIDCKAQKSKCKDPVWAQIMTPACGQTCGLCNAGSCKDAITGCASLKSLCRDYTYRTYMAQNCAKTCKACSNDSGPPQPPPRAQQQQQQPSCQDGAGNCANMANMCSNPSYQALMSQHCKKTCGLC
jgi:hypothetical protein